MANYNKAPAPSIVGLPPEIIRSVLKYLLPYKEDIILHPKEYFYSTENLVPATSPVPASYPAILATCSLFYGIGCDLLYGGNTYTFHFKASRQYKWPMRNPRHGMIFPLTPQRPHRSRRLDGSYSGFDRLPRSQIWNLHRVNIEVHENLQRGFLELRDCFEVFANAVIHSKNLRFFELHIGKKEEQDYQDAFMAVYDGDDVPKAVNWLEEQKVKYMLEPLIDMEGLSGALITGAVDEKFAAKLANLMTSTGRKVARSMLHLKSPKLHWMRRQRDSLGSG